MQMVKAMAQAVDVMSLFEMLEFMHERRYNISNKEGRGVRRHREKEREIDRERKRTGNHL